MDWKAVVVGIFALIALGLILANKGTAATAVGGTLATGITGIIAELERNTPKGETVGVSG